MNLLDREFHKADVADLNTLSLVTMEGIKEALGITKSSLSHDHSGIDKVCVCVRHVLILWQFFLTHQVTSSWAKHPGLASVL